jgi:ribosomal protein S25
MIRQHHYLRAARHLDVAKASAALDEALAQALDGVPGITASGLGAYRVISAGVAAKAIARALEDRGVLVRTFRGGRLGIIPALDQLDAAAAALANARDAFKVATRGN